MSCLHRRFLSISLVLSKLVSLASDHDGFWPTKSKKTTISDANHVGRSAYYVSITNY